MELVDLDSAHLLFTEGVCLLFLLSVEVRFVFLTVPLLFEFLNVSLHVENLLGLVKRSHALLEELVLDMIVGVLGHRDLLSGLVVTELARLGEDGDVRWWVDLLKHHLQLVKKAERQPSLLLHDLLDNLGVELDLQVAKHGLQLLEVLQLV